MTSKRALVTGASRGLGYAMALELARAGWHVIAVARTQGALEELADAIDETPGDCTLVPLDITDDPGLQRMALAIHERWGHLDALVHAAAHAAPLAPTEQINSKDFDLSFKINAKATQRLIMMCDPLLRAAPNRATALMIDDQTTGQKFHGTYTASKAAAKALVDQWAVETATIGPRVLSVSPAAMPTSLRARFYPGEDRNTLSLPEVEAKKLVALLDP